MAKFAMEHEVLIEALPTSVQQFARAGSIRHFPKRTRFIAEGELGLSVYLLLSGRAKVFTSDSDGKEFIYGIHSAGSILGEMAIDGQSRSASVEAVSDVVCSVITTDVLRQHIVDDIDFAMNLIMTLIQRSRHTTAFTRRLALESAYERLASLLQELAIEQNGSIIVSELLSQQDIADRIGTSRDMVSKIFKELVKGEYLSHQKKQITLLRDLPKKW